MNTASTIEEYLSGFSGETLEIMEELRRVIKENAPASKEVISYGMPAYRLHSVLVYFAAQKKHLGFYPTASAIEVFSEKLKAYHTSKGTVRFPYNLPLPYELIAEIVRFRYKEDMDKYQAKKRSTAPKG